MVIKCITSRRDSRVAPSRCGCVAAQRDGPACTSRRSTTQPCSTILLKAIEWLASVMHSSECPASSYYYYYGPISHCFRDTIRYWLKIAIANFWYPTSIWRPVGSDPVGISQSGFPMWKTRTTGPPGDQKSLIVSLAVSIQYTNVTDGQTDGYRTSSKTTLCIASRGKTRASCMRLSGKAIYECEDLPQYVYIDSRTIFVRFSYELAISRE